MAERVYYHHKKAAASAMLAKLVELTPEALRPRDDEEIYPAPWNSEGLTSEGPPHMVHLSDVGLLEYLGHASVATEDKSLQRRLYSAIVSQRRNIYRTLLVIDYNLANDGLSTLDSIITDLRGTEEKADSTARRRLEVELAEAADSTDGEVIIYCPSSSMQSKEVDARMEIDERRVLPLRIQGEDFTCHAEVELLKNYYKRLWRAYIFVSADIYANADRCRAVVDAFCRHFNIVPSKSYSKVRGHDFRASESDTAKRARPRPAADLASIFDEVAASLGENSPLMTRDELKTAIVEQLSRASDRSPIRKKEPQRTVEFEEELLRALGNRFQVQKSTCEENPVGVLKDGKRSLPPDWFSPVSGYENTAVEEGPDWQSRRLRGSAAFSDFALNFFPGKEPTAFGLVFLGNLAKLASQFRLAVITVRRRRAWFAWLLHLALL
jgi:hypothetical protein